MKSISTVFILVVALPFWISIPIAKASDPCDLATNDKLVNDARAALDKLDKFVGAVKAAGFAIPSPLSTAIKAFKVAAKTEIDLIHAAGQVDYQVEQIVKHKERLCAAQDENMVGVCEAGVAHQWQSGNIANVLDWK